MSYGTDPLRTVSYWQKGFDDGFSNRRPTPPQNVRHWFRSKEGYINGYQCGVEKRLANNLTLKATP